MLKLFLSILMLSPWVQAEVAPSQPAPQILMEKHVDLPSNSINSKLSRIILPVSYKTPLHTHQGPGPRYVLKGKVKFEESGESHIYVAGESFWESGNWMTVENVGETEAEILIFEVSKAK